MSRILSALHRRPGYTHRLLVSIRSLQRPQIRAHISIAHIRRLRRPHTDVARRQQRRRIDILEVPGQSFVRSQRSHALARRVNLVASLGASQRVRTEVPFALPGIAVDCTSQCPITIAEEISAQALALADSQRLLDSVAPPPPTRTVAQLSGTRLHEVRCGPRN